MTEYTFVFNYKKYNFLVLNNYDLNSYLSINFLCHKGESISSKFIPNSFDPKKIIKKLNLLGFKYCLELFGWQMLFKFEPLFVEATWLSFTEHAYFYVKFKYCIIIVF